MAQRGNVGKFQPSVNRSIQQRVAACLLVGLAAISGTTIASQQFTGSLTIAAATAALAQTGPGELVLGDIARFLPPGTTMADMEPSYATEKLIDRSGDLPAGFGIKPVWEKVEGGKTRVTINIAPGTSLYGTGEIGGPLKRNGRVSVAWNTDAYAYKPETVSLYKAHPWVLAVNPDGTAFGVMADTTYRTEMDLRTGITFTSEGGPKGFPIYVISGKHPKDVMEGLGKLIGPMPLPPLWAIGYHQCRYSYNPEQRVREVTEEFRKRRIPADVIWFDIDYMAGYRAFAFDRIQFPDPLRFNRELQSKGWSCIWMINPGLKLDPEMNVDERKAAEKAGPEALAAWEKEVATLREILRTGTEKNVWVQDAKGQPYRGAVWPGMCHFPDYTMPETRKWWAELYKPFMAQGIDGVWNDMNEPAIFNVASKTMPEDNIHRGGKEPFGDVKPGNHARFHNVYGMLMAKGTYEGILAANPDKRPFVLSRAGYIGSQRYAASWTGDNSADWNDLEQSVPMAINLGLSGQPFAGPDIGGFNGNGPGDNAEKAKHFARWMGIGSLLPFSRGHTGKGNIDKEPWSFGEKTERTCRLALERRYRLLPFFYTLFAEASRTNMPVIRPVFFADPADMALRSEDDTFLVGDDILVIPQMMPDGTRIPLEPKGIWRQIEIVGSLNDSVKADALADADLPVLKLRGGAIVPMGPVMQFSGEKPLDPLTLLVSLDAKGEAKGELYEDAGNGFGYKQGDYLRTFYSAKQTGDEVVVSIAKTDGKRARIDRTVKIVLVTDGGIIEASGKDGTEVRVKLK